MNSSRLPLLGMTRVMVGSVLSPPTVSLLAHRKLKKMASSVVTCSNAQTNWRTCRLCGSNCKPGGDHVVIIASLREMMSQVGLDLGQDLSLCPYCLSQLPNLVSLKRDIDRLGERLVTMIIGLHTLFTMDLESPLETLGDEGPGGVLKFEEDFDLKVDPSYDPLLLGLDKAESFDDDDQLPQDQVSSPSPSPSATSSLQTRHRGGYKTAPLQKDTETVRNDEGPGCNNDKGSSNGESITSVKNQQKSKRRRGRPRKQEIAKTTEEWSGKGGKMGHGVSVSSQQKSDKTSVPKIGPPYSCYFCDKPLGTPSDFETHLRLHTRERLLPSNHPATDVVKSTPEGFLCPTCGKTITVLRNFRRHLHAHTGERPHVCTVCGRGFSLARYLELHMGRHVPEHERKFLCALCPTRFGNRSSLSSHIRTVHASQRFPCPICNKVLSTAQNLKFHSLTHTREKPHACNICSRRFGRSSDLGSHMRKRHVPLTGERPMHSCSHCPKRYSEMRFLRYHFRQAHTPGVVEQRFDCLTCGKSYRSKGYLVTHERIHTGETPFICPICSKGFRCSTTLKMHSSVHVKERPYACTKCPRRFTYQSNLSRHVTTVCNSKWGAGDTKPGKLPCYFCGKEESSIWSLMRHIRIHTLERPFGHSYDGRYKD